MVWIVVHAILGFAVIGWVLRVNPLVLKRPPDGPAVSALEATYVVVGLASWVLGYVFNIQFVHEYAVAGGNPIVGDGSWQDYIVHLFDNPAASSASQDYIFVNVVILPLFTIVDGRRRGIPKPWLFFVSTLFTSARSASACTSWLSSGCGGMGCGVRGRLLGRRGRRCPVVGRFSTRARSRSWDWVALDRFVGCQVRRHGASCGRGAFGARGAGTAGSAMPTLRVGAFGA